MSGEEPVSSKHQFFFFFAFLELCCANFGFVFLLSFLSSTQFEHSASNERAFVCFCTCDYLAHLAITLPLLNTLAFKYPPSSHICHTRVASNWSNTELVVQGHSAWFLTLLLHYAAIQQVYSHFAYGNIFDKLILRCFLQVSRKFQSEMTEEWH